MSFPQPELLPWQIWLLGPTASMLTVVISWIIEKIVPWIAGLFKKTLVVNLNRTVKTAIVGLAATCLAYWWFPFSVPAWPFLYGDLPNQAGLIWQWIGQLLTALTPYVGAGMVIYNVLIGYLTDPTRRSEAARKFIEWLADKKFTLPTPPTNLPTK